MDQVGKKWIQPRRSPISTERSRGTLRIVLECREETIVEISSSIVQSNASPEGRSTNKMRALECLAHTTLLMQSLRRLKLVCSMRVLRKERCDERLRRWSTRYSIQRWRRARVDWIDGPGPILVNASFFWVTWMAQKPHTSGSKSSATYLRHAPRVKC